MAYSALADLEARIDQKTLIQLTNDGDEAESVIDNVITQAIVDADELINLKLRARYSTSDLASTDPMVKKLSVDLAEFNLWNRRTEPPTHVVRKKEDAMRLLDDLQKGTATLTTARSGTDPRYFKSNKASTDREYTSTVLSTIGL